MSQLAPTPAERAKLRESGSIYATATGYELRNADHTVCVTLPGLLDALDAAEKEIARLKADKSEAYAMRMDAAEAEVERLKAGGCARGDQHTTQHCAEAAGLATEVKRLREACEYAWEFLGTRVNPPNPDNIAETYPKGQHAVKLLTEALKGTP